MSKTSQATAEHDLERAVEYQRVIEDFTRTATGMLTEGDLLHHASTVVAGVTHVSKTKVLRYRPTEGDLLIVAGIGWKEGVVGCASLPIDQTSPAGRALQTGLPSISSNLPDDPDFAYPPVLRDHNVLSMFNVPVRQNGAIWGVFEVDSEKHRHFDEIDIRFLATYANILGLALSQIGALQSAANMAGDATRQATMHQMMMRELNHRTRNNFQLISSFLSLQRRGGSEELRDRLGKSMNRVQAVSLAHDQLSLDRSGELEFSAYLKALCANIAPQRRGIEVVVTAPITHMTVDRAVHVGLIANELVTNAIKHAFGDDGGTIRLKYEIYSDRGKSALIVEDNGKGMSKTSGGGLGLNLVRAFAAQIGGRLDFGDGQSGGARVSLNFPLAPRGP